MTSLGLLPSSDLRKAIGALVRERELRAPYNVDAISDALRATNRTFMYVNLQDFRKRVKKVLGDFKAADTTEKMAVDASEKARSKKSAADSAMPPLAESSFKCQYNLSDFELFGSAAVRAAKCCVEYVFEHAGANASFVIAGPSGNGKTSFAHALADFYDAHIALYSCNDLLKYSSNAKYAENAFTAVLDGILKQKNKKCVVIIDNFDIIASLGDADMYGIGKGTCQQAVLSLQQVMRRAFHEPEFQEFRIIFIATFDNSHPLLERVLQTDMFTDKITLDLLNNAQRQAFFARVLPASSETGATVARLAQWTGGLNLSKLQLLAANATKHTVMDKTAVLDSYRRAFQGAVFAAQAGFEPIPDITWADIGGMDQVKKLVEDKFISRITHTQMYSRSEQTPPGLLLYGPPGCGKTLVTRAIANAVNANLIVVRGPEILNKFVGESERAIRSIFSRARACAPCIIYFDEFECLCPRRASADFDAAAGDNSVGLQHRLVSQLLTEMDGYSQRMQVFVIASTNMLGAIDPAMLRSGRFDRKIEVSLPSAETRLAILNVVCRFKVLDANVSLSALSKDMVCAGFTGADIKAWVDEAYDQALKDLDLSAVKSAADVVITNDDMKVALAIIKQHKLY